MTILACAVVVLTDCHPTASSMLRHAIQPLTPNHGCVQQHRIRTGIALNCSYAQVPKWRSTLEPGFRQTVAEVKLELCSIDLSQFHGTAAVRWAVYPASFQPSLGPYAWHIVIAHICIPHTQLPHMPPRSSEHHL